MLKLKKINLIQIIKNTNSENLISTQIYTGIGPQNTYSVVTFGGFLPTAAVQPPAANYATTVLHSHHFSLFKSRSMQSRHLIREHIWEGGAMPDNNGIMRLDLIHLSRPVGCK